VAWCVCQSVCLSRASAMQKRLNGSGSCLEWRLLVPKEQCRPIGRASRSTQGKEGVKTMLPIVPCIRKGERDSMRPSPNYFGHLLSLWHAQYTFRLVSQLSVFADVYQVAWSFTEIIVSSKVCYYIKNKIIKYFRNSITKISEILRIELRKILL